VPDGRQRVSDARSSSLNQLEAARTARRNLRGVAAMVGATALFTCGDAAMKLVSNALPVGETVFVRGVSTVVIVTIAAFWTGAIYRLRDALVRAMGWRSVGDVGSALFFQAALARMPFADLMGILQVTPLSLTAASALFLGERVGWRRWTAVAAGFAGALLVIKPGSSAFNAWALLGVLSVLCGTLRDVSTRRLDVALSPLLIMLLSQLMVASAGLACSTFEAWKVPGAGELLVLVFASVFSLLGHLCVIYSLRSGELAAVAPFRYAGIVWAILLGFLIWKELPDALSLGGISILVSAGLYTLYREQQLRQRSPGVLAPPASVSGDRCAAPIVPAPSAPNPEDVSLASASGLLRRRDVRNAGHQGRRDEVD
jgi:drug/metabolite transporter (DMT)-like permease